MKKNILFILAFIITMIIQEAQAQANFSFDKKEHDFGTIQAGKDTLWTEFVFVNNGLDPLQITSVKTSCDCTLAEWPKQAIQPGQKARIRGGFKIEGKSGPFDKSIIIIANTTPATTFLTIKGEIK